MSLKETSRRLEQYTRTLIFEGPAKSRLVAGPILPEEKSLFETIDQLWQTMQRVEPDEAFKNKLYEQVLSEARRELSKRHLSIQKEERNKRSPWIASAAVMGAAATLAGAYAYWRWNTSKQAA
jgi:hypothetical protein